MKMIKQLVKHMKAQLDDAEEYAEAAILHKDDDPKLADMYTKLAKEELVHKSMQHEQAVRLIHEYRAKGNEPPAAMLAVWDWEHEQLVQKQTEVRTMLGMVN